MTPKENPPSALIAFLGRLLVPLRKTGSAMLSDTAPDVENLQIALLRKASVAERIALVRRLSAMAIGLARRAIARAHPGLSPAELDAKFVELHYGEPLAAGLREHLNLR